MKRENADKQLYKELRALPLDELWKRVDAGETKPGLIRALGAKAGNSERARIWLRGLLTNADEKVRRYAVSALPKVGAGAEDEKHLLELWNRAESSREKENILEALGKFGSPEALSRIQPGGQRIKALQSKDQGSIRTNTTLRKPAVLNFHCRAGLEGILRAEIQELGAFQIIRESRGTLAVKPRKPFTLLDVFSHRCFSEFGFSIPFVVDLPETIASAHKILETFSEGTVRYRIEFAGKGHQRAAVRALAENVYARRPEMVNSPSGALWTISIKGRSVEAIPKIDPRFEYRQQDVPAASHPPLAACMARLAGLRKNEIVWDPFCGSGLELIERALRGGVAELIGSDRDTNAVEITRRNFAAAGVNGKLLVGGFLEVGRNLRPTLIVTNPPMGKRVPIPDLQQLIQDLFALAADILPVGGRLVLANPVHTQTPSLLKLEFQTLFDMGGFHCRLEKYVKAPHQ